MSKTLIPILSVHEMSDERWNERAREDARMALESMGKSPTEENMAEYFRALRARLLDGTEPVEVTIYALPG